MHPSTYHSTYPSIHPSFYLFFHSSIHLPIHLSITFYLSIHPSIHPSIILLVYPSENTQIKKKLSYGINATIEHWSFSYFCLNHDKITIIHNLVFIFYIKKLLRKSSLTLDGSDNLLVYIAASYSHSNPFSNTHTHTHISRLGWPPDAVYEVLIQRPSLSLSACNYRS